MGEISLEGAKLVRRMALRALEPRDYSRPSERDIRDNSLAVRELVMIGILDYVMIDLEESLIREGLYRQGVKRVIKRCCGVVSSLHGDLYRRVLSLDDRARWGYNELRDRGYSSLCDQVSLEVLGCDCSLNGLERDCSLVCALCRLILGLNDRLRGRYDYRPIEGLGLVLREVGSLGFGDRSLDCLVDKAIVTR